MDDFTYDHPSFQDDGYAYEMAGHECLMLAEGVTAMIDRHGLTFVAEAMKAKGYEFTAIPPKAIPVPAAADVRVPF